MNTVKTTSPYIRKEVNTSRMMLDVVIALLPVTLFSIYRFGMDAITRIVLSVVVMVLLEAIFVGLRATSTTEGSWIQRIQFRYKTYTINHAIIPALSGVIFALIIPSKLPFYGVIIGASFGIVVVKMLFGGTGQNIFNVAAAGRIFVGVTLSDQFVGAYPNVDFVAGSTALSAAKGSIGFENIFNHYTLNQLFIGNIPGSMGEISALLIILGGMYLIVRRSADFRLILGTIIPFMILTLVAGFMLHQGLAIEFMLFHLFSGGILFGAVYMITDPVTAPLTTPGRLIYALIFAGVTVLIRLFGAYPEGVAFAILIANAFASLIDFPGLVGDRIAKKSILIYSVLSIIFILSVWIGSAGV